MSNDRAIEVLAEATEPGRDGSQWQIVTPAQAQKLVEVLAGAGLQITDQAQHQAVLDCINLYGDETLHKALDAIGWVPRISGGSE